MVQLLRLWRVERRPAPEELSHHEIVANAAQANATRCYASINVAESC